MVDIRAESIRPESWDDLVLTSPAGTVFHEAAWLSETTFLLATVGGELVGGMPLAPAARESSRPHMIPYGGPIVSGAFPHLRREVHRAFASYLRVRMPGVRFSTSPWIGCIEPWIPVGFHASLLYTAVVDITSLEEAYRRFSPILRRNLRATANAGLSVHFDEPAASLAGLVDATFARHHSQPWFDLDLAISRIDFLARERRAVVVGVRDRTGDLFAGVGVVWDARRAYYVLGGRAPDRGHRGALSSALWGSMQYVRERMGLVEFDLEGSNLPAVAAYFAQFGGEWRPFHFVRYSGQNVFES